MFEVKNGTSGVAAKFFPIGGNTSSFAEFGSPWGNPGLSFGNSGNMFDLRGYSDGLELVKNGKSPSSGFRILWNTSLNKDYGFVVMGGSLFGSNYTPFSPLRMFVDGGINTERINIGAGINSLYRFQVRDITSTGIPLSAFQGFENTQNFISIEDGGTISLSPYAQTGLSISLRNNLTNSLGVFCESRKDGGLFKSNISSQTTGINSTALTAYATTEGQFLTTGNVIGLSSEALKGRTTYGVKSNAGDPFIFSETAYGGYFTATGDNSYGIYAKANKATTNSGTTNLAALLDGPTRITGQTTINANTTINGDETNNGNIFLNGTQNVNGIVSITSPTPNASGLFLNNLASASSVQAANGFALSVNATGHVIKVPFVGGSTTYSGGTGITVSGTTINSVWTQTGNDISNNNTGDLILNGKVGLSSIDANSKMNIVNSTLDKSLNIVNTKTNSQANGIYVSSINGVSKGTGVMSLGGNTGVYGEATGDLDGLTSNECGSIIYDLKGLHGYAENFGDVCSRAAIGVKGEAYANNSYGHAIGVYGYADNQATNSTSKVDNDWAIYADGNSYAVGGTWTSSDKNLKTNIEPIRSALNIVEKLEGKTYDYRKDGDYKFTALPNNKQYGFLAQELEKVLPELVTTAPINFHKNKSGEGNYTESFKAVNYTLIIPILTQAIKEQQTQIEDIKSENQMLKERLANIEKMIGIKNEGLNEIKDALFDPNPNPSNGNTEIKYQLSQEYSNAYITIMGLDGKKIESYKLNAQKGKSSINADLSKLASGTYLYSLVAGERVIDSKKVQIGK